MCLFCTQYVCEIQHICLKTDQCHRALPLGRKDRIPLLVVIFAASYFAHNMKLNFMLAGHALENRPISYLYSIDMKLVCF